MPVARLTSLALTAPHTGLFKTVRLAYLLHSLVRVSRRDKYSPATVVVRRGLVRYLDRNDRLNSFVSALCRGLSCVLALLR